VKTFGDRSRFCIEVGPAVADRPPAELRRVDVWAADRWLTCDDNLAFLPSFTASVAGTLGWLLTYSDAFSLRRPHPELSVADNHRRLLVYAEAGDNRDHLTYRFMCNWGPTADNVMAHVFLEGRRAYLPFSFWREHHHDPSELGQVFVVELPEREVLWVLHKAAWALVWS
jgi:hypothetical protein